MSLSGTVRDFLPAGGGASVAGVQLRVLYKEGAGPVSTSGADGAFRLTSIAAGQFFQLQASKDGYESLTRVMSPLTADASADLAITPVRVTIRGRVTETAPTENTAVVDAVVEITTGSNRGKSSRTDGTGAFTLSDVWGDFDVSVTQAGYQSATAHVASGANPRLDVHLPPRETRLHTTFTGGLCTSKYLMPWQTCTQPLERTHTVTVHRPGPFTVKTTWDYVGDYYSNALTVQVSCGTTMVAERTYFRNFYPPDDPPLQLALTKPCSYAIKLTNFVADTKGGFETTYRVDVDYPQ